MTLRERARVLAASIDFALVRERAEAHHLMEEAELLGPGPATTIRDAASEVLARLEDAQRAADRLCGLLERLDRRGDGDLVPERAADPPASGPGRPKDADPPAGRVEAHPGPGSPVQPRSRRRRP